MKRAGKLFEKIISDENLLLAIEEVNSSHRWNRYPDKPNKRTLWVEATKYERVKELRQIITGGFKPSPCLEKRRYDPNAGKWRNIWEPRLWPDQYIHHALIQVLEPVMMRGMDRWCCGSIKNRGAHYGIRRIKKWLREDKSSTRWCAELDIRRFYESVKPEVVMRRFRRLVKDRRALDLLERIIADGIKIGFYTSQWLMNTLLQPLDVLIRQTGIKHYIRYMDNFTLFSNRKKSIDKAIVLVDEWLRGEGLELKSNWQKFKTDKRPPNALGYRYKRNFVMLRKHSFLRLKRQLRSYYRIRDKRRPVSLKMAQGLLSRLGMLRHCNSAFIYKKYVRKGTQAALKAVVRRCFRKEHKAWSMYLEQLNAAA